MSGARFRLRRVSLWRPGPAEVRYWSIEVVRGDGTVERRDRVRDSSVKKLLEASNNLPSDLRDLGIAFVRPPRNETRPAVRLHVPFPLPTVTPIAAPIRSERRSPGEFETPREPIATSSWS